MHLVRANYGPHGVQAASVQESPPALMHARRAAGPVLPRGTNAVSCTTAASVSSSAGSAPSWAKGMDADDVEDVLQQVRRSAAPLQAALAEVPSAAALGGGAPSGVATSSHLDMGRRGHDEGGRAPLSEASEERSTRTTIRKNYVFSGSSSAQVLQRPGESERLKSNEFDMMSSPRPMMGRAVEMTPRKRAAPGSGWGEDELPPVIAEVGAR
eukprot:TRINITY_DN96153_c0_g1_i1.p1 TRINITY_DN96153_c0_g1~~TRINITY_DN96153_c0_g1_i1.p1  ORF type:complete len:212 (-),score=37.87 TRINITY_DN96153_c0_g1_i1:42-677(-)